LPRVGASSPRFLWLVGLILLVTNLIVLRTATTNYVILYIPLFFVLKLAADRLPRANLWLALFYLLSIIGSWVLFLATVQGDYESPIMYLPLPLLLFFGLLWAKSVLPRASAGQQAKAS